MEGFGSERKTFPIGKVLSEMGEAVTGAWWKRYAACSSLVLAMDLKLSMVSA